MTASDLNTFIAPTMRIYDLNNQRLYINLEERNNFLLAAGQQPFANRLFGLTLLHTGCRLSEALDLTKASVDTTSSIIAFRTLKKRNKHSIREVPIPPALAKALRPLLERREHGELLWNDRGKRLSRITGYRWIKNTMQEAGITGSQASPKGLRHGYGVFAIRKGIPINMLSKWMGHASIATTSIYANAVGKEEREIASKMWR